MKVPSVGSPVLTFDAFISHMVQMKAGAERSRLYGQRSLYPTWFRWKSIEQALKENKLTTLYPTWFRWKFSAIFLLPTVIELYIPHGSDERNEAYQVKNLKILFISHMVQMKVFLVHLSSFPVLPLYPTWFRWKIVSLF